ncbi:hypothetical protein HZA55_09335 [Candidatus Poribacteria bacterium]|nr:hypothetical protein [Candidatus Poribacteria bacterium]
MNVQECPGCNAAFNQEDIVCSNCGNVSFPNKDENYSGSKIALIIFGYFFIYFLFGLVSGSISNAVNNGGIFTAFDMGIILLGISLGNYFSSKGLTKFLLILSGGALGSVTSTLIYGYFIGYSYLNMILNVVIGTSMGTVFGVVFALSKQKNHLRILWILIAGIIGGIIANCIDGIIISLKIIEEFNIKGLMLNSISGLKAGLIFGLCFLLADKAAKNKNAFLIISYGTLGAILCGGILGAIVDGANFNPYWSGLFEVHENIFLSIRTGFLRDGIICGSVALGIAYINTIINKNNRIQVYVLTVVGGIIGGLTAVYLITSIPYDFFNFSALQKSLYDLVKMNEFSKTFLMIFGGTFGGLVALGNIIVQDVFKSSSSSNLKRIITQSLGGFLGGIFAGIVCGIIITSKATTCSNIKLEIALIFLISTICAMYGLLTSLGMNLLQSND